MTLETMVAISQLVAAIGVILSLLFLALQLRQNTKAIRSASIQNIVQSMSETAQTGVENQHLVPIMLKANAGLETLSEEDRARLHFWFVMAIRRFEGVYFQRTLGLVDPAVIDGFERSNLSILASKSGRVWWSKGKEIFNSQFVSYVDAQLSKVTPEALHPVFMGEKAGYGKGSDN
jgi:hypothetical protein